MSRPHLRSLAPRSTAVGAALLAGMLGLSACGGGSAGGADAPASPASPKAPASPATPTPSVAVPAGVTLTDPGTTLGYGEAATVPYQPNDRRSSVLRLRVTKVQQGTIDQLSAYVLDRAARRSTPYYVHVKVANAGEGDVGGTDVPLWVVDQHNTLIHSSSFTNDFRRCPSRSLPHSFGPGDTARRCLVYLVPDHGRATAVSFRPLQAVAAIEWHGTIVKTHDHGAKKKHGAGKKGAGRHTSKKGAKGS